MQVLFSAVVDQDFEATNLSVFPSSNLTGKNLKFCEKSAFHPLPAWRALCTRRFKIPKDFYLRSKYRKIGLILFFSSYIFQSWVWKRTSKLWGSRWRLHGSFRGGEGCGIPQLSMVTFSLSIHEQHIFPSLNTWNVRFGLKPPQNQPWAWQGYSEVTSWAKKLFWSSGYRNHWDPAVSAPRDGESRIQPQVPALLRWVAQTAPATKGSQNLPPHRFPEAFVKKPQDLGFPPAQWSEECHRWLLPLESLMQLFTTCLELGKVAHLEELKKNPQQTPKQTWK